MNEQRRVVRIVEIYAHASTTPCRAITADGREWVLKLAGAGPGPCGLLIEYLALAVAAAFGAPVPRACPLYVPRDLPWQIGTDEFDDMIQRSAGWNLGVSLIEDANPLRGAEALEAAGTLPALARADAFLQNVDRTAANPNLLRDRDGAIHAIDFDACLFLTRALSGREPSFELPRTHLLVGVADAPVQVPEIDWRTLIEDAPSAWIEATQRTRHEIVDALSRYASRWTDASAGVDAQPEPNGR